LASGSWGGEVYQWDLINSKDNGRINDFDFVTAKNVRITGVAMVPGKANELFCVGTDRKIYHHTGLATDEPYDAQVTIK
jgi:hypothetical protein